ncbi:hypothetical protein [Maricaulis sp.]|uniref:hypothetical protein n=1 Tax=Maricaulis sp. TaxID=1486257 RepID=UPI002B26F824|nr:hypothetical protein [Maricaulis sp.]
MFEIDRVAREKALKKYVIPECLHVPIAARDETTISTHVGRIVTRLSGRTPFKAFLVAREVEVRPDRDLPIWDNPASAILHQPHQVWVHVRYSAYRAAYKRAFPGDQIDGLVLSHAMNRRLAIMRGFEFVRITPASRASNSSSAMSENWGIDVQARGSRDAMLRQDAQRIEYADLTSLLLMMDIKIGGGTMEVVNEAQSHIRPR